MASIIEKLKETKDFLINWSDTIAFFILAVVTTTLGVIDAQSWSLNSSTTTYSISLAFFFAGLILILICMYSIESIRHSEGVKHEQSTR